MLHSDPFLFLQHLSPFFPALLLCLSHFCIAVFVWGQLAYPEQLGAHPPFLCYPKVWPLTPTHRQQMQSSFLMEVSSACDLLSRPSWVCLCTLPGSISFFAFFPFLFYIFVQAQYLKISNSSNSLSHVLLFRKFHLNQFLYCLFTLEIYIIKRWLTLFISLELSPEKFCILSLSVTRKSIFTKTLSSWLKTIFFSTFAL